ncbi:MAG: S24/S26 family peptidase [Desulfotomaculaceae bacterium]|nr:S24/S26 family peptidase [Desulfotomaculaceae bacterium]
MRELSPLLTEVLENAGEVTLTITGNSMLPLLRHRRDKVCLVKPDGKLKKYDIPLFLRADGKYILHRIVGVKADGYVIIGDNQYLKEYQVRHSQVIGVVKGFWRNGKFISCDDFGYRVYSRLWVYGYPFRRGYFWSKQFFVRTIKFLSKMFASKMTG